MARGLSRSVRYRGGCPETCPAKTGFHGRPHTWDIRPSAARADFVSGAASAPRASASSTRRASPVRILSRTATARTVRRLSGGGTGSSRRSSSFSSRSRASADHP